MSYPQYVQIRVKAHNQDTSPPLLPVMQHPSLTLRSLRNHVTPCPSVSKAVWLDCELLGAWLWTNQRDWQPGRLALSPQLPWQRRPRGDLLAGGDLKWGVGWGGGCTRTPPRIYAIDLVALSCQRQTFTAGNVTFSSLRCWLNCRGLIGILGPDLSGGTEGRGDGWGRGWGLWGQASHM